MQSQNLMAPSSDDAQLSEKLYEAHLEEHLEEISFEKFLEILQLEERSLEALLTNCLAETSSVALQRNCFCYPNRKINEKFQDTVNEQRDNLPTTPENTL